MRALTFFLSVYDDGSFVLHAGDAPAEDAHAALITRVELTVRERMVNAISDDYQDSLIVPWVP